jgi:histone demethylase JARID1
LNKAKIWAEAVSDCLSKVEGEVNDDSMKVHLEFIDELLRVNPVPCFNSGYLKLKDYAEEARKLSEKIDSALSSSPTITQLELLHSEVSRSPISLKKHEILSKKISSAKMLAKRAKRYLTDAKPPGIEMDALFKLNSEMLELHVQLPETEGILDLVKKSESARDKSNKVLTGSLSLENVEELLHEFDSFSINVPELNILRQYHVDTLSWISRFNDVMVDVREGKDQRKLISDLSSLLRDGASLGIQVEGLPLVEVELKKASCREKARTVYTARKSLDFIEQLLSEAVILHIEEEEIFVEISGILSTARCWEERASTILENETQMYELKDLVRMSVNIDAVLPTLQGIENTISSAETWLQKSEPFLSATSSMASSPCSMLELPVLKDLVTQAKLLNVQLQEPRILETLLLNCERWQCDNHQLLQETEDLLDNAKIDDGTHSNILPKIMDLITRVDSARRSGLALGLNFDELPKLRTASLKLGWCCKTITLSSSSPTSEVQIDF